MAIEHPENQSWRGIDQKVNPRTLSPHGRRRFSWNVLSAIGTILLLGAMAAVGVYLIHGFESPATTLAPVVKGQPLRDIVVLTDGVLTRSWVSERLGRPEGVALMAVDLEAVKQALAAEGQIRSVLVARDFPDTLVVTLSERVPVIRVFAPLEPGRPEPLLVAGDGVVYRGAGYDPLMIGLLPWLDGVRLSRQGAGLAPIKGVDRVSELLLAGQQDAPLLARQWRVVSLAEWPRLVVRTPEVREIVFEPGNLRRQFAWLDHILDFQRAQPEARMPERIDLSFAARAAPGTVPQVAVKFAPLSSVVRPARAAGLASLSHSNLSRPQNHRGL